MEYMKQFKNNKKFTWLLASVGTIIILYAYAKNIPQINSVWELVDEYGYLANGAYLSGTDWAWVTNKYYGYGYSLWLVPLFWVCSSGTRVIQGAILINTMCVAALFHVQNILMWKICKKLNKNIVVLISFSLCFYPYLFASGIKVFPDCLLTLMIWICGLLLYQAFSTEKRYYYIFTAIATVYTFFVHTRAFIFCAAIILVIVLRLIQKSTNIKNVAILLIVGGIVLLLGFVLKNHIIDNVYSVPLFQSMSSDKEEVTIVVGNTVTVQYMLKKILAVFENFSIQHVYSFACKNFYLFVSTAGMFHIGIGCIISDIVKKWKMKCKLNVEDSIKLIYGIAAVVMILALIVQNFGNLDKPAYYFYGRYYEYLVGPVAFIGLEKCMSKRLHIAGRVTILIGFLVSAFVTLHLEESLNTWEFYFDSNRMASFAYCAHQKIAYGEVIGYWLKVALVAIVIILILNYFEKLRKLVLFIPLILFLLNNRVVQGNILYMHQTNTNFYEIATFIHTNYEVDEVYFLNGDFIETTSYAGVQSLLGQEKLILIETKDSGCLETGDLIVTYRYNSPIEELETPVKLIGETKGYAIYLVE